MYIDIHTHSQHYCDSVIKIVNISPIELESRDVQKGVSTFFSVGVHPWDAAEGAVVTRHHTEAATFSSVIALGEAGLDKAHPNTERQVEVFLQMINISETNRKPLIIHAVRSYPEIIETRKLSNAKMPWIIHSFQGTKESAKQLLKHNIFLSLGEILFNKKREERAIELLESIPAQRLFLETDDSGRDIAEVYERASTLMRCDIERLKEQIFINFKNIFYNE